MSKGEFGPYVERNKLRATLGKAHDIADITLETALDLLCERQKRLQKKHPQKENCPEKNKGQKSGCETESGLDGKASLLTTADKQSPFTDPLI